MKDKIISFSDVMSVKSIITVAIYGLSEAPALVQKIYKYICTIISQLSSNKDKNTVTSD